MREELLTQYDQLAQFLALFFGSNCEVVVHEITEENSGIYSIYNNGVSGRNVGDPLTRFSLKLIEDGTYKNKSFIVNYEGKSKDTNKIIRSATFFIKDKHNHLVGMLCINHDISLYKQVSDTVLGLVNLHVGADSDTSVADALLSYSEDISETIPEIIEKVLFELDIDLNDKLETAEKIQIISILQNKGIFNVKGAIPEVAKTLNISEPSIYRYLANLKK